MSVTLASNGRPLNRIQSFNPFPATGCGRLVGLLDRNGINDWFICPTLILEKFSWSAGGVARDWHSIVLFNTCVPKFTFYVQVNLGERQRYRGLYLLNFCSCALEKLYIPWANHFSVLAKCGVSILLRGKEHECITSSSPISLVYKQYSRFSFMYMNRIFSAIEELELQNLNEYISWIQININPAYITFNAWLEVYSSPQPLSQHGNQKLLKPSPAKSLILVISQPSRQWGQESQEMLRSICNPSLEEIKQQVVPKTWTPRNTEPLMHLNGKIFLESVNCKAKIRASEQSF